MATTLETEMFCAVAEARKESASPCPKASVVSAWAREEGGGVRVRWRGDGKQPTLPTLKARTDEANLFPAAATAKGRQRPALIVIFESAKRGHKRG